MLLNSFQEMFVSLYLTLQTKTFGKFCFLAGLSGSTPERLRLGDAFLDSLKDKKNPVSFCISVPRDELVIPVLPLLFLFPL